MAVRSGFFIMCESCKLMGLPDTIRLLSKNGEEERDFRATVFRIETRYEDGTPENLTLIKDDTVVELSENEDANHFLVCYVPVTVIKDLK